MLTPLITCVFDGCKPCTAPPDPHRTPVTARHEHAPTWHNVATGTFEQGMTWYSATSFNSGHCIKVVLMVSVTLPQHAEQHRCMPEGRYETQTHASYHHRD